jgi:hypothetical protein
LLLSFEEIICGTGALRHSLSKDYKEFKALVKTEKIYEHIQQLFWAETGREITREEAKKIMFTISFSSYRYQPEEKQIMKKYFPSVVALIDAYKRAMIQAYEGAGHTPEMAAEKGNASFAILLQQTESLIFIDEILAKCHKRGIKALSKHDSIVCRACDKHKVTKIVCKVLNRLFGRYTYALDIDGELFDLQPRRKSRISRVASAVVQTLFGLSGYAHGPPSGSALPYSSGYRERIIGNQGEKMGVKVVADMARQNPHALPGEGDWVRRFKFRG